MKNSCLLACSWVSAIISFLYCITPYPLLCPLPDDKKIQVKSKITPEYNYISGSRRSKLIDHQVGPTGRKQRPHTVKESIEFSSKADLLLRSVRENISEDPAAWGKQLPWVSQMWWYKGGPHQKHVVIRLSEIIPLVKSDLQEYIYPENRKGKKIDKSPKYYKQPSLDVQNQVDWAHRWSQWRKLSKINFRDEAHNVLRVRNSAHNSSNWLKYKCGYP